VHALGRIHRSLTDHGVLLDLHPEPKNSRAEVGREGAFQVIGEWDQEEDIRDIRLAREQLDLVETRGAFVTERQTGFDILEHYASIEDWLDRRPSKVKPGSSKMSFSTRPDIFWQPKAVNSSFASRFGHRCFGDQLESELRGHSIAHR